ncbi:MAG: MarR family winged helix-turn-helix transcriptional regulator [Thermaurantiacus sp.]
MSDDPPLFRFFTEIGIIDQLAGTLLERVLPAGLTRAQFGVLNHFVRLEPGDVSPARLAEAFQVTRPTMTSTLQRLERAGLVAIRPDPADGRGRLVSITPAGRAARAASIAALAPLLPQLAAIVTPEDLEALLPRLTRIRQALDASRNLGTHQRAVED